MQGTPWQRAARAIRWVARLPEIRALFRFLQILSSLLFVVLYVWGTYSTPKPFSWRFNMDIALCALFATEFLWRLLVSQLSVAVAVLLCIHMQAMHKSFYRAVCRSAYASGCECKQ